MFVYTPEAYVTGVQYGRLVVLLIVTHGAHVWTKQDEYGDKRQHNEL